MKHKILGLLVGGLTLLSAAPALASVTVSVEVEGLRAVVPPTTVTTPATLSKDGGTCPTGDNVLGALDAVTKGDWTASSYGGQLTGTTRILTEDHPFVPGEPGWVFVVNGKATADYGCGAALKDGDKLLWYASAGFGDYRVPTGYDDPVLLDGPATAVPGQAFTVTATDTTTTYDGFGSPQGTAFAPSAGATVKGGTAAATTGADGKAAVTVAGGPYTLVVTKGNRAPARITGCATTGSDGLCGTTKATAPPAAPCVTNGHDGFCGTPDKVAANAAVTAVTEGRKYAQGKGPRQLAGKVESDGSGLADVRLRLTRNDKGKCSTYDGRSERFKTIKKCGATHGTWFSVGANADWSYLLPAKLARGRYVLDLQVVDKAGNKTAQLARGTSRVVFTVA
jgi:Bacterial Ig-like domain